MKDWFLRKITDYWDSNNDALHVNAKSLSQLSGPEYESALIYIRKAVTEHARVLSDDDLLQVAWIMVDEIYKSVSTKFILQNPLLDYLSASAETLSKIVKERGYAIQYLVDNAFAADEIHMMGPIKVFPLVFNASGLKYICPQELAIKMMKSDAMDENILYSLMPRYIEEARDVSNMVVNRCHEEKYHYIFIDTNSQDNSFDTAISQRNQPGVIIAYRCEAPVKGSKVHVLTK